MQKKFVIIMYFVKLEREENGFDNVNCKLYIYNQFNVVVKTYEFHTKRIEKKIEEI